MTTITDPAEIRSHLDAGDVLRTDTATEPLYLRRNEAGQIEMEHSHREESRVRAVIEGTSHESLVIDESEYEWVVVDEDEYPMSQPAGGE